MIDWIQPLAAVGVLMVGLSILIVASALRNAIHGRWSQFFVAAVIAAVVAVLGIALVRIAADISSSV